jgi:hypothetical protein
VVNPHYKFTVVDIGMYRRNSDKGMCAHFKLQEYLETRLNISEDKHLPRISQIALEIIVDDKELPINTYLTRP